MSAASPKSGAVLLEVSVREAPSGQARRRRVTAALLLALVVTLAAAAGAGGAGWLAGRLGGPGPDPVTHERGAAGVAAAYGRPLGCLEITILPTAPSYARADFDHRTPCGRYTGDPTAIFHYVAGGWRAVLDAVDYACPVPSLPAAVQAELGVCLTRGGQPSWRVGANLTTPALAASRSRSRARRSTPSDDRPRRG